MKKHSQNKIMSSLLRQLRQKADECIKREHLHGRLEIREDVAVLTELPFGGETALFGIEYEQGRYEIAQYDC